MTLILLMNNLNLIGMFLAIFVADFACCRLSRVYKDYFKILISLIQDGLQAFIQYFSVCKRESARFLHYLSLTILPLAQKREYRLS